jgi:uncharacterized protein (DUF302 family)
MNGLHTQPSSVSFGETITRIKGKLAKGNVTLFAEIDHAAGAAQAGLTLRLTTLLIFGDPRAGTVLMQDQQMAGIDLPLKILVWEDENGKVWMTYNELAWIKERHSLSSHVDVSVQAIGAGMQRLVDGI